MVWLEWAHIESFDSSELAPLHPVQLAMVRPHNSFRWQPHIRLLALRHPVDDLLITVRSTAGSRDTNSNNAKIVRKHRAVRQMAQLAPQDIYLAVHRHENSVYYKRLAPEEFGILAALHVGLPLEEVIEQSCAGTTLDMGGASELLQPIFTTWSMLRGFVPTSNR